MERRQDAGTDDGCRHGAARRLKDRWTNGDTNEQGCGMSALRKTEVKFGGWPKLWLSHWHHYSQRGTTVFLRKRPVLLDVLLHPVW